MNEKPSTQDISTRDTLKMPVTPRPVDNKPKPKWWLLFAVLSVLVVFAVSAFLLIPFFNAGSPLAVRPTPTPSPIPPTPTPTPSPTPVFDPAANAILPDHRVIAFYAVPFSEPTGPAYQPTEEMYQRLQAQGAEYEKLDPDHPVKLGIDLVVSVPDDFPGEDGSYSHHVDEETIQTYVDFCKKHDLLLFLDLNFGQSPVIPEVNSFLPYLEKYDFVHMAIDPEWMFPRRDGVPGVNLSNVRASDLNPIIQAVAEIPMKYHVSRKILVIHQYRPSGDGMKTPNDAAVAELADKRNLVFDSRVDVVLHVDSVGGYNGDIADKQEQYKEWVQQDMEKYKNFSYGGFKIFYKIESKTRIMTPKEVLAMDPAPLVVTYGN